MNGWFLAGTFVGSEPLGKGGAIVKVTIEQDVLDKKTHQTVLTRFQFVAFPQDVAGLVPGDSVAASGWVQSREWQGKLYFDLKATSVQKFLPPAPRPAGQRQAAPLPPPPTGDEIPF